MRGADPLAAAVAGGAVLAFLYWVGHGMTDWFWEWAGLGAPAFALLGLACALAPRRVAEAEGNAAAAPARRRPVVLVLAGAALVLGALAIAGPWQAERDIEQASAVFAQRPFESYSRLDRAADLDPAQRSPGPDRGLDRAALRRSGAGAHGVRGGAGSQPARAVRDAGARGDRLGPGRPCPGAGAVATGGRARASRPHRAGSARGRPRGRDGRRRGPQPAHPQRRPAHRPRVRYLTHSTSLDGRSDAYRNTRLRWYVQRPVFPSSS